MSRVSADRTEVVELPSEVFVVLRVVTSEDMDACDRPGERVHSLTLEEPLGDRELGACAARENVSLDPRCNRAQREVDVTVPSEGPATSPCAPTHAHIDGTQVYGFGEIFAVLRAAGFGMCHH